MLSLYKTTWAVLFPVIGVVVGILQPFSFQRMENIGHMPQLEAPEDFSAILITALKQVAAPVE